MKQSSHGCFFFIFFIFLLFSQSVSSRFSAAKQGKFAGLEEPHKKLTHGMLPPDHFSHIMGELEDEEEEWERRMMLEAHLDYVYTQNEKP